MLSTALETSFGQLGDAISRRAAINFREEGTRESQRFHQAGHTGYSTFHIFALGRTAAKAFEPAAAEAYQALMTVCAAEPTANVQARISQLQDLLDSQLNAVGKTLMEALNDRIQPMAAKGRNPAIAIKALEPLQQSIAAATLELRAKVQIEVSRRANSVPLGSSVHIGDNAIIGALQSGTHATATFTQTVNLAGREELKSAVDALIAVVRASNATAGDQREIVEVLEEVKAEADKPAPNKLRSAVP